MKRVIYHRVASCALTGLNGVPVEIEVTVLPGLPRFEISGRGDSAIRESRDRVRAAIGNVGYVFPKGRVIASYAPAALPKQGSAFDLPLALAILAASSQAVRPDHLPKSASFGELALNGRVKPVQGALGRLLSLRDAGIRHVIGPAEHADAARWVDDIVYEGVSHLREAIDRFSGVPGPPPTSHNLEATRDTAVVPSFLDVVRGQEEGVRAAVIAAAGWHPMLLMGAPGSGKTSLASAVPDLLPPLTDAEAMDVLRIRSVMDADAGHGRLPVARPFRHTHHSLTTAALIGGGVTPTPGECTLAHRGVLFLDEVTEVKPHVLDALREPLETMTVHLARARWTVEFPADFLLIAACNPCRCGYLLEPGTVCRCTDAMVRRHLSRISGPLFDRFDMAVHLTRVTSREIAVTGPADPTDTAKSDRARSLVTQAWAAQARRAERHHLSHPMNGRVPADRIPHVFAIEDEAMTLAGELADRTLMSPRAFFSMLKVARTIADLDGRDTVGVDAIAEAHHFKGRLPFAAPPTPR